MMNIVRVIDSVNRTIIVILLQKVAVYTGFCRPACKRSTVSVIPQPQGWTVTRKRRMLECRIGGLVEVDGNVVLVPQRFVDSQHHVFLIHSRVLSSGTSSVPGFPIRLARAMPLRYFVRGDFGYRLQGYRVIVHHGALCGSEGAAIGSRVMAAVAFGAYSSEDMWPRWPRHRLINGSALPSRGARFAGYLAASAVTVGD